MGEKMKKWAAALAVALLCAGAAGMAASMQVMAAEETELTTVVTTQRCSIWSAPATTEENRVKYVDAGYQITIYPEVIESELGDGKTFYRTMKGAYVLCRCVEGAGIGTESEAQSGNPSVPEDDGILIPVGNVPFRAGDIPTPGWGGERLSELEIWYDEERADGEHYRFGIIGRGEQDTPTMDRYGITYRGYDTEQVIWAVERAADEDEEIAQFLEEYGKVLLIGCGGDGVYCSDWEDDLEQGVWALFGWAAGPVECQRGSCTCMVISVDTMYGAQASINAVKKCLHAIMEAYY